MKASILRGQTVQVLALVAAGLTNKEIAARLDLAESTVKWHVSKLLAAFDAPNRAALAVIAVSSGALDLGRDAYLHPASPRPRD